MDKREIIHEKGLTETPESYWISSTPTTEYPALEEDIKVDAAIVGGGMAGITTAFLLKKEGLKVAIIDSDRIVQGTSAHTTAKVTSQHNLIYYTIKSQMSEEKARQYAQSNEYAIGMIEGLIKEKNIDCDFEKQSAYVYTLEDKYVQKIMDEAKAASELGIKAAYLDETPLPFPVKAAVRFDNQAQFHPRKYLLALANEIPGNGSYIFEQTRALDVEEGTTYSVLTEGGKRVSASKVIIASHFPFYDGMGMYFTRLYPKRSYILGIKIREQYPGGMYITAEHPGRSLRSQKYKDGEMVLVAGEHHKTGQGGPTMGHYENLRGFAKQTFEVQDVLYRWSTHDFSTPDNVPYIGRHTSTKPDIYVTTGFGKWGMTGTTVSAMIIRDLIIKGESPWEDVYNPSRFTPAASSAKTFLKENFNVAGEFISGKLETVPDEAQIKPGEAKIIESSGQRTGAYRDEKGTLHLVDTTCTHMGCELQWNDAEKSWDCPCHGSRFTYEGDIIEGPALKRIKPGKENSE